MKKSEPKSMGACLVMEQPGACNYRDRDGLWCDGTRLAPRSALLALEPTVMRVNQC